MSTVLSSTDNQLASPMSRRHWLKAGVALGAAVNFPNIVRGAAEPEYKVSKGRINQSVIHWCFSRPPRPMNVEELASNAARMGLKSVELVTPEHFPTLKKYRLTCAIVSTHGFAKGFAHKSEHEECLKALRERIDAAADARFPSVITFSGFRRGLSDEEATRNMVEGLKQIVGQAEKKKVTVCLEMLNSRVNVEMKGHPDYFCDNMDRTVDIIRQVGSERVKVLFDIYHVQIMHGDIITRIKQYAPHIGHYHTAGVPGRGELDDTQEINYVPIMKAIVETGYRGYVGQEFIPTRDKMASLNEAVRLCDV